MNRNANIVALIEKNRIALLRMVYCWLSAAICLNVRSDKPLPRRLAAWASDLICTAEKATSYLLIAVFYQAQTAKRFNPAFEQAAMHLLAANGTITLRALTIAGIIKRLKTLQQMLLNLHAIARRLAKSIAAHRRVMTMKIAAFAHNPLPNLPQSARLISLKKAVPP